MNVWQIVCAVGLTMVCLAPLGGRAGEPLQPSPPHSPAQAQNHAPWADASPVAVPEPSAKALRHYHESLVLSGARILWMLLAPALIVGLFYIVHWLAERLIARCKARFGFDALSDIAALPLILFLVWLVALVGLPIPMAFSRHMEHEADRFGLELTHNNHAAATAQVKLQEYHLGISRPGIIVKLWLFTHPPAAERIEFCNCYRPWETGRPSRYEEYLKP